MVQALFQKSSKWSPWQPTPEALDILERREREGLIQGLLHSRVSSWAMSLQTQAMPWI
jgi:hypothetical protein